MARTRAWRRYKDYTKAKRKQDIDRERWRGSSWWHPWYSNLHEYSKNKIHCSCGMCSCKTNNRSAKKPWWGPTYNPSMQDRRIDAYMRESEFDFFENL